MSDTFRIKPLAWKQNRAGDWWCATVFGSVGVYRGGLNLPWERINLNYEGTPEEGKAIAERRYRELLMQALELGVVLGGEVPVGAFIGPDS